MNEKISHRIRMLRGQKSQAEFASAIGVSLRALKYYESGDRVPPGTVLAKIAEHYNVTVDWILSGAERPEHNPTVFISDGRSDTVTEEICTAVKSLNKSEKTHLLGYIQYLLKNKKKASQKTQRHLQMR